MHHIAPYPTSKTIILILIMLKLEVIAGKLSAVETLSLYLPPSLQSFKFIGFIMPKSSTTYDIAYTNIMKEHTNCSSTRQKTHVHVQQSE